MVRYELLEIAKRQPNFSYINATLKKRLCPRKPNGEPVESKLANDCYILYLASNGEFSEDLKTVLSVRSHNSSSRKYSIIDDEPQSEFFVNNLGLKDTVVRVERDLNSLRGDYTQEIEYLNNVVSTLSKENKQLVEINTKHSERFRNFQNQITSIRHVCDASARVFAELRSQTKKQQSDRASNSESLEQLKQTVSELKSELSGYSDELHQLQSEVKKFKQDLSSLSNDFKELRNTVKADSVRINQISDSRVLGVQSFKAKTDLLSDRVKEINDSMELTQQNCASFTCSITDLLKRLNKTEKDINRLDKSRKSYADFLTLGNHQVSETCENNSQPPISPNSNAASNQKHKVK